MRAAGFAVVFVLSSAIVAAADPITFQLSGTVTQFFPDPSLGFSASPGDRFVAVLTLPSGLTDSQPGPRDATFLFHGSEAEFSLNVGSGELVGIGAGGFADVHLDNFLQAQFAFVFPARFPDESGHTASVNAFARFAADEPPFLATDAIPTAAELNRLPNRFLNLNLDCCDTPFFTGEIQTVSGGPIAPTPEPASLALLATGVAGAAFSRRRRCQCSDRR